MGAYLQIILFSDPWNGYQVTIHPGGIPMTMETLPRKRARAPISPVLWRWYAVATPYWLPRYAHLPWIGWQSMAKWANAKLTLRSNKSLRFMQFHYDLWFMILQ